MVNIVTMGMFNNCCHRGGGAVPRYYREEEVKPFVRVTNLEIADSKSKDLYNKMQIKLVDDVEE